MTLCRIDKLTETHKKEKNVLAHLVELGIITNTTQTSPPAPATTGVLMDYFTH